MIPREEALQSIKSAIAWLDSQTLLGGSIHLFDSHVIAQEVYRRLLNELHGLQLEVTDNIHQNFPAIDLGDAANKRCFQVTSESKGQKIQEALDAYAANGLNASFGKFQVVVIGKRQRTYSRGDPHRSRFAAPTTGGSCGIACP